MRALEAGVGQMLAGRQPYFLRDEARQRLVELGMAFAVQPGFVEQPRQPSDGNRYLSGAVLPATRRRDFREIDKRRKLTTQTHLGKVADTKN